MNFKIALLLNGAMPEGRVFGLDQQTVIGIAIQLFNLCVLAVVLSFILYKPVREFMNKRTDKISAQINDAKQLMNKAEKLKEEYEKKIDEIEQERTSIIELARQDASKQGKQILEEAKNEAAILRQRAQNHILSEKENLKEETRLHIIEVSTLMAAKFLKDKSCDDMQNKFFEEAITQLEEAKWQS